MKNFKYCVMVFCIVGILVCILKNWNDSEFMLPLKSINDKTFREKVQTGDLLLTRSSNNFLSRMHSRFLGTPIAHVGLAVVEKKNDTLSNIYLFEAGPRGAQLRNINDYMNDGADCLWWRKLNVTEQRRKKIALIIEYFSFSSYSWNFMKDIPKELLSFERNNTFFKYESSMANSCGDLVAKIYNYCEILKIGNKRWMPGDFIKNMNFLNECFLESPINIIFSSQYKKEKIINNLIKIHDVFHRRFT